MFKCFIANATFQFGKFVFRSIFVDMLVDFTFFIEKNIVNWAGDFTIMNQRVSLHVLYSFEFHVTFGTGDTWK